LQNRLQSSSLGSTGRVVSRLGFGGAPAGLTDYLGKYSPEQRDQREHVVAAVQRAVELGVTYFDTAASYGKGESEKIFGEALEGRAGPPSRPLSRAPALPRREGEQHFPLPKNSGGGQGVGHGQPQAGAVFLATKVSHSEPDVRGSIERSLRNLRVDAVDLVQVHGGSYSDAHEDAVTRPGGVLETLEKARDEGLIRHIGFTTEDQNAPVYRFIRSGRFDVMQIEYNLLFQHPYSPDRPFGAMVEAEAARMGIVTMRTLTSGVFQKWVRAVRPDDTFDYSAALLQFVLSNPLVDVALVGMRTPEEVERNVAVLNDIAHRVDISELHSKYV
jgi:aryl-alcohol dehydrogenase-like predicted oxidoreductase